MANILTYIQMNLKLNNKTNYNSFVNNKKGLKIMTKVSMDVSDLLHSDGIFNEKRIYCNSYIAIFIIFCSKCHDICCCR